MVPHRVAQWQGTAQDEYLRPATVYGPKFDGYLQAARAASNGHSAWAEPPQPIYRDEDFDEQGEVKPQAAARERQRGAEAELSMDGHVTAVRTTLA